MSFFKDVQKAHPDFELPSLEAPHLDVGLCQNYLREALKELKSKTIVENEASKEFACPITQEVFKDPVVLGCGHTFEREALEEATKEDKRCPLDRQPITSVASNFGLKNALDKWKKEDPLPTFSSFQRSNPGLAQANLAAARAFAEEEEYDQALTSYKTAFQYTKNPQEYAEIPQLYKSLKNPEKERLAWLHYALYSLEEGDLSGIAHLEQAKALEGQLSPSLLINFVLIMLYSLARRQIDPQKVKDLIQETIPLLGAASPQATFYAQQILLQDSTSFPLYEQLAQLLKKREEIQQLFFKGALHALNQKELAIAGNLYKKASQMSDTSITPFEDLMLAFQIYPEQDRAQLVLEKAQALMSERIHKPARQAFKMLFHHEKNPAHYKPLLDSYFQEKKTKTAFPKATRLLDLYLEQRSYDLAQELTDQVVSGMELSSEEKVVWYKKLEALYENSPPGVLHRLGLEDIYEILGEAYESQSNFSSAQAIYEKALSRFNESPLFSFKLASVLARQHKIKESVLVYYAEAERAILKQDVGQLERCYRAIVNVDHQMTHLDGVQKIHLVSQMHMLTLTNELKEVKGQLVRVWERFEATDRQLAIATARLEAIVSVKPPEPPPHFYPATAFGKAKWNQYFGEIGEEPPLPPDIQKTLQGPCPFWPGKTIQDTHMLVLLPTTVNGAPLTLSRLQELVKHPKQGPATQYQYYWDEAQKALGDQPVSQSSWVLMTKDVIPESRFKNYGDQSKLVETWRQKTGIPYQIPGTLEAAVCILLEHVQSGTRLYSDSPSWTYTRCHEKGASCQMAVGGFGAAGLRVYGIVGDYGSLGVACLRKS
jgi:tetratricopeptide (TPR) repeat protein